MKTSLVKTLVLYCNDTKTGVTAVIIKNSKDLLDPTAGTVIIR